MGLGVYGLIPGFQDRCPLCGGGGCAVRHGLYFRRVEDVQGAVWERFPVPRFLCRRRGPHKVQARTFSVLPTALVPRRRFSLFRNINQRVLLRYRLPALSERETASYIAHHLSRVGGRPEVFSGSAVQAVHKTSGGICRMVNSLCLAALNLGARQQLETLTEEHIYQISSEV